MIKIKITLGIICYCGFNLKSRIILTNIYNINKRFKFNV